MTGKNIQTEIIRYLTPTSNEDNSSGLDVSAKPRKSIVFKLNIIYGVMMFAAVLGIFIFHGGEISNENVNPLGVILIIAFVLGVLGVIITNVVNKIIHTVESVKSIVTDIKTGNNAIK